jgi:hypothetical protein
MAGLRAGAGVPATHGLHRVRHHRYRRSPELAGAAGAEDFDGRAMVVTPFKPRPPQSMLRWDIYRAAAKANWIGTVEAVDADAAIKDAAKEFNIEDPKKLFAVPRR